MSRTIFTRAQLCVAIALFAIVAAITRPAVAGPVYPHLFVGIDDLQTIASGTFTGQANPNYNRLIFLYGHSYQNTPEVNHFHGIGAYMLTGTAANPTVRDTSTNNSIPEPFTLAAGGPALRLTAGTGAFAGLLRSSLGPVAGSEYEGLGIRSVGSLNGSTAFGEQLLFDNLNNPRYRRSLGNTTVLMELVSITPGLRVTDDLGATLLQNVGDTTVVGTGDTLSLSPVFVTDANAAPGIYRAEMRLRDQSGALGDSGRFSFVFSSVNAPEPGSALLLGVGLVSLTGMIVRRRRA